MEEEDILQKGSRSSRNPTFGELEEGEIKKFLLALRGVLKGMVAHGGAGEGGK